MRGEPAGGASRRAREALCVRRTARCGVVVVVCLFGLSLSACKNLPYLEEVSRQASLPRRLENDVVNLITSRFPVDTPPVYFSSRDRYRVNFIFDPSIVRVSSVQSYVLWRQDRPAGRWERLQQAPVEITAMPIELPVDGAYGLRASAIYDDGREVLVPGPGDQPLVWLWVDRAPPSFTWFVPLEGDVLELDEKIELRWAASEMQFGLSDMTVSWSPDGPDDEAKWRQIGGVRASKGEHAVVWRVPVEAPPRVRLRVTGKDFVGNRGSASIRVRLGHRERPPAIPARSRSDDVTVTPESPARDAGGGVEPATTETPRAEPQPASFEKEASKSPAPRTAVSGESGRGGPAVLFANLETGDVLRGGVAKYVFFETSGLEMETAQVIAEWREKTGAAGSTRGDDWHRVSDPVPAARRKILWQLPPRSFDAVELRLRAFDDRGNRIETTSTLAVDVDPPVAEIGSFRRDERGLLAVAVDAHDRGPAGLGEVSLYVSTDGGETWTPRVVENAAEPVSLADVEGKTVGLWLRAVDRVGLDSGAPKSGATPQKVLTAAPRVLLDLRDPPGIVRGGDELTITWRLEGAVARTSLPGEGAAAADEGEDLALEISPNGVAEWQLLARVPARQGRALVLLPAQDGDGYVLRGTLRLSDGTFVVARTKRFALDGSPPQLSSGSVPKRASSELTFPLRVTDPGGGELAAVHVLFRRPGEGAWKRLPPQALTLAGGRARLDVAALAEGRWEIALSASDSVGNSIAEPTAETAPLASVVLDRTPPNLVVKPTAFPWIEGRPATVEVEFDRVDATAPLVLERKEPGGSWREVHRWVSLPPGDDLFRFTVPVGVREDTVRFSIADDIGNVSRSVLQTRPVEAAIRLLSLADGGEYPAGSNQPIRWEIHPALGELEEELRVAVSFRSHGAQPWQQIYDGLPVTQACVWTLPSSPGTENELRLRLFHGGELVGGARSQRPFVIRAREPVATDDTLSAPPASGSIEPLSSSLSRRAEIQLEMLVEKQREYEELRAQLETAADPRTGLTPEDQRLLDLRKRQLDETAEKIKMNFHTALQRDSRNHRATYGLARVARLEQPASLGEPVYWLERTVALEPNDAAVLNDLAACYIRQSRYEDAEKLLQRTTAHHERADLRFNLALALYYQRKTAAARGHLEALLARRDSSVRSREVMYYLVATYIEERNWEEARRRFDAYQSYLPEKFKRPLAAALEKAP